MRIRLMAWAVCLLFLAVSGPAMPQDAKNMDTAKSLDNARLDALIRGLDGVSGNIESEPGFWLFEYQGRTVYVVINPVNGQLQIMAPIVPVNMLNHATLIRTLEANFSATNEARYAIAKGLVWSVYVNSLATLVESEFVTSLKQVVSTAKKFSGLIVLEEPTSGGNDSGTPEVEVIRPKDNATEEGRS